VRGALRDVGDLKRAFGWGKAGRLLGGALRPRLRG
jgi:hypothetical protein